MTADLLERARAAVTVEEEALVIFEAIQHSALPVEQRRELCRIIMMAGKEVPRPVLLGVVAALVPEDWGLRVDGPVHSGGQKYWEAECGPGMEEVGTTPALALLIAILEASNAD